MIPFTVNPDIGEPPDPEPITVTSGKAIVKGDSFAPWIKPPGGVKNATNLANGSERVQSAGFKQLVMPTVSADPVSEISETIGVGPVKSRYGFIQINGCEVPDAGSEPYDVTDWLYNGVNTIDVAQGMAESNFYLVPGYYIDAIDEAPVLSINGQCFRFIGYPDWRRHYTKTVEVDVTIIATRRRRVAEVDADCGKPCG